MKTSEATDQIIPALVKFAGKASDPTKGRTAEVKGKSKSTGKSYTMTYTYASLPDLLPDVRGLLAEFGMVMLQSVSATDKEIVTRIAHESGQWVETAYPIPVVPDSQKMGSAHTYARRYAALQTLSLAPDDDDDGAKNSGENAPKRMAEPPPKVEPPQAEEPYRWPDSDRRWFMGRLTALGFDYTTQVAPFTESEGWGRPSGWGRVKLERFVKSLEGGDVRAKLESFCNVGD